MSTAKRKMGKTVHICTRKPRDAMWFFETFCWRTQKIIRYNLQSVELEELELACISIAFCGVECKSTTEVTVPLCVMLWRPDTDGTKRGSIGLDRLLGQILQFFQQPPFLPERRCDSGLSPHHFHSPSHSQLLLLLLLEPRSSCPWSCSGEWMTRRCSGEHWSAQRGGTSLKSCRFFSLRPGLCKNPATPPPMTSSIPRGPNTSPTKPPSLNSHWSAAVPPPNLPNPTSLPHPPSAKRRGCFPTIPSWHGQSLRLPEDYGWLRAQYTRLPDDYCCGFSSDASPWPYGHGNPKTWVNAEINSRQGSILQQPILFTVGPTMLQAHSSKGKYYLWHLRTIKKVFNPERWADFGHLSQRA